MKIRILHPFFFLWFCVGVSFAQNTQPLCATDELYKKDPRTRKQALDQTLSLANTAAADPNTVFTLPVVFVVYHLGEPVGTGSNLSDAKLNDELTKLNDAFRARGTFAGLNDSKIQFERAKYDSNCAPATGIVRVNASSVAGYAANGLDVGDNTMLQSLRALHNWNNRDEYITIELVHKLNGASGYAGYLSGYLVIEAQDYWYGLTAHEMGHCLNLRHTFEGDNGGSQCPPNTNPETQGDLISDTDPHKTGDRCANYSETSLNVCSGVPFGKLLSNFMSYGFCWDRFTPKQIERMRNSLASLRPQWLASKALTGLTSPPVANAVERCGPGTVTLSASACSGTYNWYSSASVGSPVGTNATYTTPNLAANTTYYVSCTGGSCPESGRTPVAITIKPAAIAQPSSCIPTATNGLSTFFGISAFSFSTIALTGGRSSFAIGSNYSDLSCSVSTTVQAGNTYPFTISSLFGNTVIAKIFIDYNSNGNFDDIGELVYNSIGNGDYLATHTGTIVVPTNTTVNTGLRMRVMIDPFNMTSCNLLGFAESGSGRAEDYTITITPSNCTPPAAPTVNSVSINSGQTATLTASNCTGTIKWYDANSGGTLLYTGNPYTTTALTVSTPYYASCTVNNCESTTRGSGTVTVSTGTCAVPTGTFWSSRTTRSFWPSWNGIAGYSYVVRYRTVGASTWIENSPALCYVTGTFSYRLVNLPSGTSFEWQVKAVCSAGNESAYTNSVFSNTAAAASPCPQTLTHGTSLLPAGGYPAAQTIVSQADVRNNTKYTAGKSVLLQPGFKVNSTQPFTATIEGCPTELPVLQYVGKDNVVNNGQNYINYKFSITNAATFPATMFVASPSLPACGANTSASRSWVYMYGVAEGAIANYFCALSSPTGMSNLIFTLPAIATPPTMVYVEIQDRLLGLWYASNIVNVQ